MTTVQAGIPRRRFLQLAAVAGGAMLVPVRFPGRALAAVSPQVPLPGSSIPKYAHDLPDLLTIGRPSVTLEMREFRSRMLPPGAPVPASYDGTLTWGYREPGQEDDGGPYVGPVIVATRGVPTEVTYVNRLGTVNTKQDTDTGVLAYSCSTDQTLHWADPLGGGANHAAHMAMPPEPGSPGATNYAGPIPAVPHLHGGEVPPELDGGPDAWFTSDPLVRPGHDYYAGSATAWNTSVYRYPNTQEAAPLWFHDHTLGATRLNVYAGLAGGYLLVDDALGLPDDLPPPDQLVPLVIQDRSFDTNGELFFPADSAAGVLWTPNPEHPYWVPEFVGDTVVVNGKVWPRKVVDRKRYRFLLLNGSNARTYEMFLTDPVTKVDGPPMWVIATDGGYLDMPVKIDPGAAKPAPQRLVMMPGERYEVIIDFDDPTWRRRNPAFSGSLVLRNIAKTPFPNGEPADGSTVGRIMRFDVLPAPVVDESYDPADPDTAALRKDGKKMVRLVDAAAGRPAPGVTPTLTRLLTLNEVMGMPQLATNPVTGQKDTAYPGGPLEVLVNNTRYDGRRVTGVAKGEYVYEPVPGTIPDATDEAHDYTSEVPDEGTTEVWEIVNVTADAHPIHLHLVQFQVMNRQAFDVLKYLAAYGAAFPAGGYDPMTATKYPGGVYIPGFGPPLPYAPSPASGGKHGGNPDVRQFLKSVPTPPQAYEAGWKDTVIAYPGQVTRIVVRWAPTDVPVTATAAELVFPFDPGGTDPTRKQGYVWHCHIIDHEDNEMMRPTLVTPAKGASRSVTDVDY